MLHLLLGRDWTVNREAIFSRISEDVKMERPGRILMVPELISHETERMPVSYTHLRAHET